MVFAVAARAPVSPIPCEALMYARLSSDALLYTLMPYSYYNYMYSTLALSVSVYRITPRGRRRYIEFALF